MTIPSPPPTPASRASLARLQELLPDLFQATQRTGQPYLRILLSEDLSVLLPMECVHESLLIPAGQITVLPNMAAAVMGITGSRDQVFCVVNLPQLLGYTAITKTQRHYPVVVVQVSQAGAMLSPEEKPLLGLAVPTIQGVTRLEANQLHPISDFCPANLQPFVTGTGHQEGQLSYILSPQALMQAPTLAQG